MDIEAKSIKKTYIFCPNPAFDVKAEIIGFEKGKPTRILNEVIFPGGKGVHVAMVLAELGSYADLVGIWGRNNKDAFIDSCHQFYPKLNVEGIEVAGFVRTCYTFITDNDWKDTELLGAGPSISEKDILQIEEWIDNHIKDVGMFAICGSWPKGAPENATARMVKKCNEHGIKTAVDASGLQLIYALKEKPFFVHLNKNELSQLINSGEISDQKELLDYVQLVAITYGKDGLQLLTKNDGLAINVELNGEVISSVGSGDALTAGIIHAFANGSNLEDLGKWGVACGAANCLRPELGLVNKNKVLELYKASKVKKLKKQVYDS